MLALMALQTYAVPIEHAQTTRSLEGACLMPVGTRLAHAGTVARHQSGIRLDAALRGTTEQDFV